MRITFAVIFILSNLPVTAEACSTYSAKEIALAIKMSPNAIEPLKGSACTWGGAGKAESGGRTCASNPRNFGVLQLNILNLAGTGYTSDAYLHLSLQMQVNVWASRAGNSGVRDTAVADILGAISRGENIGAIKPTQGMAAACVQFGHAICANDLSALKTGQPCGGANPVKASLSRRASTWTEDGNGQTICSWGRSIQRYIDVCMK